MLLFVFLIHVSMHTYPMFVHIVHDKSRTCPLLVYNHHYHDNNHYLQSTITIYYLTTMSFINI